MKEFDLNIPKPDEEHIEAMNRPFTRQTYLKPGEAERIMRENFGVPIPVERGTSLLRKALEQLTKAVSHADGSWYIVPKDPENQPDLIRIPLTTVAWCRDLVGISLELTDGKQGKVVNITPTGGSMAFALVEVEGENGYRGVDLDLADWQVAYGSNSE